MLQRKATRNGSTGYEEEWNICSCGRKPFGAKCVAECGALKEIEGRRGYGCEARIVLCLSVAA